VNKKSVVNPDNWGVSFSIKQCRNFDQNPKETLAWLIEKGFRRFRLMSYWDELEKVQAEPDFSQLDWQIDMVERAGGVITLCLGARQPRWPENHWPDWAWAVSFQERSDALGDFITQVVQRYKNRSCIVSYQLENEALLESFGLRSEVSRSRLRAEYALVHSLDPDRPIIMTTSTSWGIPIRRPRPKILGFSVYNIVFDSSKQSYGGTEQSPLIYRLRALLYKLTTFGRRKSFIHELQCEPWGPRAIWEMDHKEQNRSMNTKQIRRNIHIAKLMRLYPIDLWGGEWWRQRELEGDPKVIDDILKLVS
jgi:hypothetical protein